MEKPQIVSKKLKIGILLLAGLAGLVIAGAALAVNPFVDIQYPVQELGGCENRQECKAFCDNPENMEPCLDFAEKIGLMSAKETQKAKKMAAVSNEMQGPGGCVGDKQCKAFCDKMENIRECIKFAEENDLIPAEELEQAKKVIKAMDQGLTPPKCAGKDECDVYCGRPENMEECIEFGIAAGLMPEQEQEEARKMLKALKAGIKPPNCAGKKECDIYCQKPENMEECMEFGIAAGFMPPEEAENAKKMLKALKAGIKPPNCRGDRECDAYCRKPENMGECIEFSIAAGFAPPGEEENMKRMLNAIKQGILPPDCRNDEECRIYCDKEENRKQCMDFNVAAGFMTQEEAEMMEKTGGKGPGGCMGEQECQAFCNNPDNARECIQFGVMIGDMTQEEADKMLKEMEMGRKGQMQMQGQEGLVPNLKIMQGQGPGGCKTPEECMEFCGKPENAQECMGPQGQDGMMGPGQGGSTMMSPEDEERLKQELQKEYGDEWQRIYEEKMTQRMEVMPPMIQEQGITEQGRVDTIIDRAQDFFKPFIDTGEYKENYQEPMRDEWREPIQPTDQAPMYEPKPYYEGEPTMPPEEQIYNIMPVPEPSYTEPVPMPESMPMPVMEPAPIIEPAPTTEFVPPQPPLPPAPSEPQGLLSPVRKFFGKVVDFLNK